MISSLKYHLVLIIPAFPRMSSIMVSTTIDLCLSLFPWATFRKHKGAVKLHTLLDLRGNIPTIAFITSGKVHEVNILDKLPIESGAIYIMDQLLNC